MPSVEDAKLKPPEAVETAGAAVLSLAAQAKLKPPVAAGAAVGVTASFDSRAALSLAAPPKLKPPVPAGAAAAVAATFKSGAALSLAAPPKLKPPVAAGAAATSPTFDAAPPDISAPATELPENDRDKPPELLVAVSLFLAAKPPAELTPPVPVEVRAAFFLDGAGMAERRRFTRCSASRSALTRRDGRLRTELLDRRLREEPV